MPWWSWVVIWVALVALSLLYVVLLGIKLWRQLVALGREVSQAGERTSFHFEDASAHDAVPEATPELRGPGWAIYADPVRVKAEYAQGKLARRGARRKRRIARRVEQGQPQSLSDLRHSGTDLTR